MGELQESILMDQMRENEEKRKREEEEKIKVSWAAKQANIPSEPGPNEPGKVDVMIKLPGGQRQRRLFHGMCTIGQLYDWLDVTMGQEFANQPYRLVSTMPRRTYDERSQTLQGA